VTRDRSAKVWLGLAGVLAGALALRVWGIRQGLPFAYNADEADHFVPRAVAMFEHGLNPRYFANPPAFTYLLHYLFALWFGGGAGVKHAFEAHPSEVYTLARVSAAALGTLAVGLLYATGARLCGRGVGLLAAALQAVAFLPVFYAHLALNDVPTLAPLTLSLLGSAGVLRKGRLRDYLLAGVGLGLACASKYTAGIALAPLAAAAAARYLEEAPRARAAPATGGVQGGGGVQGTGQVKGAEETPAPVVHSVLRRRAVAGLALAAVAALGAFLVANPYALLDWSAFHHELVHQSSLSAEAQGKLGAPRDGGLVYYLWALTWGLGWAPALAALGGALTVWRRERRVGWLLVPAPLLYLAFMGLQGRYFGRWLMPILPPLCLLAALFSLQVSNALARRLRRPALAVPFTALLVAGLLAQGAVHSVHAGITLSRADTRNLTRAWMLAHVPAGAKIVVEPVAPGVWAAPWRKYVSLQSRISSAGTLAKGVIEEVGIEDYERTLAPALIGYYEAHGYCWVVSGSTESGRAFADSRAVPHAIAYYRALAAQGEVVFSASPYARGARPPAFNFDWSFDYYPLAYRRPGPQMTVYRLHGGRCGR
jgi:4-amino-4-deoxy-L-arabinose transferase-like glycosyltransferase